MYKVNSSIRIFISLFAIFILFSSAHALTFQTPGHRFISYTDAIEPFLGKSLVLIHAFPTDKRLWDPQEENLRKHFRVITIDLWGFGQSSSANGQAITMSEYADEVSQLLDHLNIKSAVIGGESMGGYIALAFLEKFPNKVKGLILSNTQSIADSPETKAKREASAIDIIEHGTANFINEFIPKAFSPDVSNETKMFLKYVLETEDKMGMASALRGMALRNDMFYVLARSSLPILIITGDKDILISPEQSQYMHALAKNSKLVVIPNAGHLSSLEQPKAWSDAVIKMFY